MSEPVGTHFTLGQDSLLKWVACSAIVAVFVAINCLWLYALFISIDMIREKLLQAHYVAIVGLPTAAIASFMLVYIFRHTSGEIQMEAWGLKIKGATGPLLLWAVCFLAMATALHFSW